LQVLHLTLKGLQQMLMADLQAGRLAALMVQRTVLMVWKLVLQVLVHLQVWVLQVQNQVSYCCQ
jgi:hypothetical protein